jgi:hypothetical protein
VVTDNLGWNIDPVYQELLFGSGETQLVEIDIEIPPGAAKTTNIVTVTATSLSHPLITSSGWVQIIPDNPPEIPTMDGPAKGKPNVKYDYTLNAVDPDGDDVSYFVDWGDGSNSGWKGPNASGVDVTISHTWTKRGTYIISAKAKDIYGAESDWTTLEVTVPRVISINNLFQQFLQNHPHIFPLLRHLMGL